MSTVPRLLRREEVQRALSKRHDVQHGPLHLRVLEAGGLHPGGAGQSRQPRDGLQGRAGVCDPGQGGQGPQGGSALEKQNCALEYH